MKSSLEKSFYKFVGEILSWEVGINSMSVMEQKQQKHGVVVKIEIKLRKYPAGTNPKDIDSGRVEPEEIIRKEVYNNANDECVS